jgi:predicted lipoprotein with Yx(FWY)xxD motif
MRGHRRIELLSALAGVAIVLVACSSSSKTSTGSTSTSPTSAAAASSTPSSTSASTVKTATDAKLGQILVDSRGKALYVFDRDTAGKVACTGSCATLWPPLEVPGGTPTGTGVTATLATVARPDGSQQVTLAGRPLYTYAADPSPGVVNGDGFGGIWHVARPAGVPAAGAGSTTPSSSASGY